MRKRLHVDALRADADATACGIETNVRANTATQCGISSLHYTKMYGNETVP